MNLDERLNNILATGTVNDADIGDDFLAAPAVREIPVVKYEQAGSRDVVSPSSDADDDYLLVRDTLRGAIDRTKGMLDTSILMALNTENPKYVDAVSGLVKTIKDLGKELVALHDKPVIAIQENESKQVIIQNNYNYGKEAVAVNDILDNLPDMQITEVVVEPS